MITVKIEGLQATMASLTGQQKQVRYAASRALNGVAKRIVAEERGEIGRVFKGPTPRTQNAVKVFSGATRDRLEVVVGVDDGGGSYRQQNFRAQGKKGTITPAQYLLAQIVGGHRVPKRFERALQIIGAMDGGDYAVFAKRSEALDSYGNISGSKLNQIITFFRKTKAEGYGGKMSSARKMKMMKGELKGMKWGMAYFRGGRDAGLPDGIWERHYPNGTAGKSFIRPILIYVRAPSYRAIFKFRAVAERVVAKEWRGEFDRALDAALRTAR